MQSEDIIKKILGKPIKTDMFSKNKDNNYIEKVGACPKCGKTINNSLGYWWCKDCGYEESNYERDHNIHK